MPEIYLTHPVHGTMVVYDLSAIEHQAKYGWKPIADVNPADDINPADEVQPKKGRGRPRKVTDGDSSDAD